MRDIVLYMSPAQWRRAIGLTVFLACFRYDAANATLVSMTCHAEPGGDSRGLEKIPLGGVVVRNAIKRTCTYDGDSKQRYIEYFSPLHLVNSGLCKSVVYDEQRQPTGTILMQGAANGCLSQSYENYVQTTGVSDDEFKSVIGFWREHVAWSCQCFDLNSRKRDSNQVITQ